MFRKRWLSFGILLTGLMGQYLYAMTLYQYDAQHRLTKVIYDNDRVIQYAYDASGTRLSRVVFQAAPMDFDRDNDVDQTDFGVFQECVSGPAIPVSTGCEAADFDHDGDVDQKDFGIFQRCFSGPNIAPAPACVSNP